MKKLLLLTAVLSLVSAAVAQDEIPLSVTKVKLRADAPVLFAPSGWKIEQRISGDLNRDKIPDAALVLVENKPAKDKDGDPTARQRALVVLLKEGKGWHRVGFSGTLLQGTRDGGAFYGVVEAPVTVSIKKGVLSVEQDSGSNEVTTRTHKFRLDTRTQRVSLIGSEIAENDRATGESTITSTNYLTGAQKITTFKGENAHKAQSSARVSTKLRFLEAITVDQRYLP